MPRISTNKLEATMPKAMYWLEMLCKDDISYNYSRKILDFILALCGGNIENFPVTKQDPFNNVWKEVSSV